MGCNCGGHTFVVPTPRQIVKGAVGLATVIGGKSNAAPYLVTLRRDQCRDCEFSTKNQTQLNTPTKGLTAYSQCEKCACVIKYKTLLKTETCPLAKW